MAPPRLITTRPSNQNCHPGAPDKPASRRSSQAIQSERAAREKSVAQAQERQQQNVQQAAAIENELQEKSEQLHSSFVQPTSKIVRQKAKSKTAAQCPPNNREVGRNPIDLMIAEQDENAPAATNPTKRGSKATRKSIEAARKQPTTNTSQAEKAQGHRSTSEVGSTKRKADEAGVRGASELSVPGKAQPETSRPSKQQKTVSQASGTKKTKGPGGLKSQYQKKSVEKSSPQDNPVPATEDAENPAQTAEAESENNPGMDVGFGGLSDEEESGWPTPNFIVTAGKQTKDVSAAPSKSGKVAMAARTQASVLTKIIPNAPQERLVSSATIANATSESNTRSRPTIHALPQGAQRIFRNQFIPLVRRWAGTLDNPWSTEELIIPMQEFWDMLTEEKEEWGHSFSEDDDDVYKVTMQRVYEWRNQIGTAAVEAVKELWASDSKYKDPEERKKYVGQALGPGLLFLYGELKQVGKNSDIWSVGKTFQGPLILQTLAAHLKAISSVNNATSYEMIGEREPHGALILALTAVERALTMYKTGIEVTSKSKFCDQVWGATSLRYAKSVHKLGKKKLDQIFVAARSYYKGKGPDRGTPKGVKSEDHSDDEDDERGLIVASSDDAPITITEESDRAEIEHSVTGNSEISDPEVGDERKGEGDAGPNDSDHELEDSEMMEDGEAEEPEVQVHEV